MIEVNKQQFSTEDSQHPEGIESPPLPENLKLSDITPLNIASEKFKFFTSQFTLNPVFTYSLQFRESELVIHTSHEQQALTILQMRQIDPLIKKQYLTKEQLGQLFQKYVEQLGIKEQVQLVFDPAAISRTKVKHCNDYSIVIMRDPPTYTQEIIQGVLDHEIGTHIIRRLNDKKQKYFKLRKKNGVSPCKTETEEGLASLNQLLQAQDPLLFTAALRYLSSILASKYCFREVFSELLKYLKDQNEAWNETVRVKRSLTDTSCKGGFYKDQAYLIGAIDILKRRKGIDFVKLHGGKINIEDLAQIDTANIIQPLFLNSQYLEKLDKIAALNKLQ